mmetsp:Transcript_9350/g.32924  ORF Transcript_9350/g.32924 Transcript_9350/m.32924 type:complete len:356 (+) Transcript_9350:762-1829(+)
MSSTSAASWLTSEGTDAGTGLPGSPESESSRRCRPSSVPSPSSLLSRSAAPPSPLLSLAASSPANRMPACAASRPLMARRRRFALTTCSSATILCAVRSSLTLGTSSDSSSKVASKVDASAWTAKGISSGSATPPASTGAVVRMARIASREYRRAMLSRLYTTPSNDVGLPPTVAARRAHTHGATRAAGSTHTACALALGPPHATLSVSFLTPAMRTCAVCTSLAPVMGGDVHSDAPSPRISNVTGPSVLASPMSSLSATRQSNVSNSGGVLPCSASSAYKSNSADTSPSGGGSTDKHIDGASPSIEIVFESAPSSVPTPRMPGRSLAPLTCASARLVPAVAHLRLSILLTRPEE